MAQEINFSEEALWAENTAARLRLLQASFSEEAPASRQKYFVEELERALRDVGPSRKKIYLEALGTRFPSWDMGGAELPVPEVTAAPASAEQLAAQLIAASANLSESARHAIARQLAAAGLTTVQAPAPQPTPVSMGVPAEVAAKLFIGPDGKLDFERACKLLGVLLEWMTLLEQAAWKLWKEVNPTSKLKREGIPHGDLKALVGRYLGGDPEVSTQQLVQVLLQSRRLIASLMVAVGSASRNYAAKYYYRYSPAGIEEVVRTEGSKKTFETLETACWKKYALLTEAVSPATIEKELRDVIARSAEEVMDGPKAGG